MLMKKNLLFLFAVLLSLLPQAMKADTWSFEWNTSKANGGQGFYNFGASRVEKDVYTTELNGVQWNASAEGTFIYAYTSKMGQYIGSAGEPPTSAKLWTDGILGKVTAVRVTARVQKAEYEGNVSVTVNGVNYACNDNTSAALESTEKQFEFSIAAADAKEGDVAIVLNQTSEKKGPLYVRKIEIDYEKAQSTVLPPVFTPAAGTYDEAQTVEIKSEAITDVVRTIYYTTDGSNPKLEGGTRVAYTEPITVAATTTFKAVVLEGKEYSDVVEAKYVINEPLKADFTTDRAFTAFYDQEFDSEEGMADWTVGEGWELANRNFKSVKADDVSSVSIAYNAQNNGTSQLTSPEFTIEEGSNVEFYAYFQAPFLIYGKWTFDVIDTENNAAHPILRRLAQQPEYNGVTISGPDAFLKCQPGALLVVVDTNRPESVESEEMLETCNRVAVIDHHRRGSSYIEKMALNYHEPYASSASELVTELLQYLVEPGDILKCEAEALLAGIVLDTKNFTNRTGGRTFEAAAYLRRAGADTSDVQRMFQGDLKSMIARYDIIRQAQLYHGDLAVAALDTTCDRVTAAKAADELLTLKGIRASFVLYPKDQGVYISARSLGEVNVQVIVEALGGGGNSTTAGGQLNVPDIAVARTALLRAIDEYFEK